MLWYNRKPHYLFKSYFNTQGNFHNLSNPIDRIIFVFKCIGYLDCIFNRDMGLKFKDYTYFKKRLLEMLN